jgi:hypothetical protein
MKRSFEYRNLRRKRRKSKSPGMVAHTPTLEAEIRRIEV